MNTRTRFLKQSCLITIFLVATALPAIGQQSVLFHGQDVEPTAGGDGAAFSFMQSLLGPDNVTYMQGDMAATDGSSADGFDAVIISSTLSSGTVRDKYEDATIGVMNWEQALMRQAVGEFNLATGGRTAGGLTEIEILDPTHPLATGFEAGPVTVFSSAHTMSFGTGALGFGVTRVAAGTPNPDDDHAILAAETGDALLGDGSEGSPATAPARRVMFFLEDNGFNDITFDGRRLFSNAVHYLLGTDPIPELILGDFNNDGVVSEVDFEIMGNNMGGHLDGPIGYSDGDMNFDGEIDLHDYSSFLNAFPAVAQGHAIPEPTGIVIACIVLAVAGCGLRKDRK